MGTTGMTWGKLNDSTNGMREVLIIIFVEWLVLLPTAYYVDQASSLGNRVKNPLSFLKSFRKKISDSFRTSSLGRQGSKVFVEMEKPDVIQEVSRRILSSPQGFLFACELTKNFAANYQREVVQQLLLEPSRNYAVVCNNLKKVYPGKDGNPDKLAVQGISLALPVGECFGMLGPNGAGKTSFINMVRGGPPALLSLSSL